MRTLREPDIVRRLPDVSTTMIYTHVLNKGGRGVISPFDGLDGAR